MAAKRYEIRKINGISHKLCRGPLHKNGAWVKTTLFAIRSVPRTDGTSALKAWCRACENANRNNSPTQPEISGYIYVAIIAPFMKELENRLGAEEAIRRCGVGHSTWYQWRKGTRTKTQRAVALRVLITLREVRQSKEVRHRKSIRRGAKLRGEPELTPKRPFEFYRPVGDIEKENRNKYRADHLEQERATQNARKKRQRDAARAAR